MELSTLIGNRELFFDVAGLIGVFVYVGSYTALQFGRIDGNSIQYCLCNGAAASLVLISLFHDFNLASAIIQIVWISVSLFGLYRYLQRKRSNLQDGLVLSSDVRPATSRLRRRY
ncbi:MAG: hypothetical protein AAF404_08815 [Pseudomonadota bacterium]